jgi:tetratricopeptide (TPR) repeat protein
VQGFRRSLVGAALMAIALGLSGPARANPESDRLRARAFEAAYNLDHDEAVALLRKAVEADPENPATYRSLATVTWLNILFRRGAITIDDYLGGVTKASVTPEPPPPALVLEFRRNADRALELAEARLASHPADPAAYYEVGATAGLLAAYSASVDGKLMAGFKSARRAFDAHERVLALDPARKDATLVVGTYRYAVASLSLPLRFMAYVVGFGGDRERAIAMLQEAARSRSEVWTEAHFALLLVYNREKRFDEALAVAHDLRRAFPRNRLLWLETGATALRAGRAREAEAFLLEGLNMLARDNRPRAFGEEAMWRYKLGAARVVLKDSRARQDLQTALGLPGRQWVKGRIHTELGKLADLAGDRAAAAREYDEAIRLGRSGSDTSGVREAERLKRTGYRG